MNITQAQIEDLLIPLNFKEELDKYSTYTIYKYMKGSIWSTGTSISFYKDSEVKITQYDFQGDYSHDNSNTIFQGKIDTVDKLKLILESVL